MFLGILGWTFFGNTFFGDMFFETQAYYTRAAPERLGGSSWETEALRMRMGALCAPTQKRQKLSELTVDSVNWIISEVLLFMQIYSRRIKASQWWKLTPLCWCTRHNRGKKASAQMENIANVFRSAKLMLKQSFASSTGNSGWCRQGQRRESEPQGVHRWAVMPSPEENVENFGENEC